MGMELNQGGKGGGKEGSYGRAKESLEERLTRSLGCCLLMGTALSARSLLALSLTHSLGRLVAFALFKMPILLFFSFVLSRRRFLPSHSRAAVAASLLGYAMPPPDHKEWERERRGSRDSPQLQLEVISTLMFWGIEEECIR